MVLAGGIRLSQRFSALVGVGVLALGMTAPAVAGYAPQRSSSDSPPPTNTGTGSRGGCDDTTEIELTALAPQNPEWAGQTISTQPTLVWFVPDQTAYPLLLQLYRYTDEGWADVAEVEWEESQQGYMSYTLEDDTELTVGEDYVWQVVMICDPDRPSNNLVARAQFRVVDAPANLLTVESDRIQRADQYAEAGLWYDAFGLFAEEPLTEEDRAARNQLLLDLAEFEDEELSEQLRLIAEFE